ncbi:MAG: hypothetical protein KKD44_20440 [Proteobacteria bacterium]|nr:hypothetical protein [Pseudomonadota bacterium]
MGIISNIFTSRKKKLHRKIDMAIDQVKHGTYNILFMRYLERFDRDFSGHLAAAVTNALFAEKPLGKDAQGFLEKNRKEVESETLLLKGDDEIGFLVADAVQIRSMIVFAVQKSGTYDLNFGKSLELLRKLDLLKKPEEVTKPGLFIVKADKYFKATLKKVKYL